MTDIFLRSGEANPSDIRLRDPTLADSGAVTANFAVTEAADTLSAAATLAIQATFTVTEADDTLTSAAVLALQATLATTEADDTLSSTATVGDIVVPPPIVVGGGKRSRVPTWQREIIHHRPPVHVMRTIEAFLHVRSP